MRAQYARADRIASSSGLSRTLLDPPVGMALPKVRGSSPDAAGEISPGEISGEISAGEISAGEISPGEISAGEISTTPYRCRCASARSSLTSPASPCEKRVRECDTTRYYTHTTSPDRTVTHPDKTGTYPDKTGTHRE